MLKSLVVLQNDPNSKIGNIAHWLQELGVSFRIHELYKGDYAPHFADGVIVLGGRPSATDDAVFPYLSWEKNYIRAAVDNDVPVFGICLGMQLIDLAMGGTMDIRGPRGIEAGVITIDWTPQAATDPILCPIVDKFPKGALVAADHADGVATPPPGATLLASSQAAYIHSLRIHSAFGVQFHPEADLERIRMWEKYRQFTPGTIEKPWHEHLDELNMIGFMLTESFVENGAA